MKETHIFLTILRKVDVISFSEEHRVKPPSWKVVPLVTLIDWSPDDELTSNSSREQLVGIETKKSQLFCYIKT